jgi:hypothetical protein
MMSTKQRAAAGLVGLVLIAGCVALLPRQPTAQGLLLALAIWSGFPLGALGLRMIHALTGGQWGVAIETPIGFGVRLTLLASVAFILLAIMQDGIYSWMPLSSTGRGLYLDAQAFDLRGGLILFTWMGLALLFGWRQRSALLAGLGLTLYALTTSFAAADWFMSVDPRRIDTSIGAVVVVQQLLTAFCAGALYLGPDNSKHSVADIAALMIACLLGVAYLELMTFIIHWYGDLPTKVEWYAHRSTALSLLSLGVSVLCATGSFAWLVARREQRRDVQLAAIVCLLGIAAHWVWLLVPDFVTGTAALLVGFVGLSAMMLLSVAFMPGLLSVDWTHDPQAPARRMKFAPSALGPTQSTTHATTRVPDPPQSPEVAIGPIIIVILGFAAFVAVSLGALRFYFDHDFQASLANLKPAHAATSLNIPADESRRLENAQRAALHQNPSVSIEHAMRIVAARAGRAYDPVSPGDLQEARP